jgi:hypothetical protein
MITDLAGMRKLDDHSRISHKLNQETPDIVTWLPVLLTTTSSGNSVPAPAQLTNGTVGPLPETENGQKTLVEDGLVFRSPEMKRSLRRPKKKKMSKKSPKKISSEQNNCSSTSSNEDENSDSFYETLRKHRKHSKTSLKHNNNSTKKQ